LVGSVLEFIDEASKEGDDKSYESSTWTFYRISTSKGFVVVRWFGSSNGYYSESVGYEVF